MSERARSSTPQSATSTTNPALPSTSTSSNPKTLVAKVKQPPPPPKPVNVFSNDGSFLERFKKEKIEVQEKNEQDKALARKKALDDRFKNRGKRPASSQTSSSATSDAKKPKLSAYEREVAELSRNAELRDEGVGVRATLK
ncbi:hypothetical protein T439DRAFT_327646 [Meredithblackwellia eburnea MCA 4105]